MRLRPDKVHDLARQIVAMLNAQPKVFPQSNDDALRVVVGSVIRDNLEEEDDIDAEVDALLTRHAAQIDAEGLDAYAMRQKFKQQVAKARGFVL